eukprot:7644208-Pyramimonas_sp.AAC.1
MGTVMTKYATDLIKRRVPDGDTAMPKVHNFQSAYIIIFDSNSNAKDFLTRARTLGVTWDDPTNRATIKLKIRMDAPPEIRKVNRVLGILWSN